VHELYRFIPGDDCGGVVIPNDWVANNLSYVAGAEAAMKGSPLVSIGPNPIFYIGADSHVHELYYLGGDDWKTLDVTHATDAPNVGENSPLAVAGTVGVPAASNVAVFFFDSKSSLREL
jgi:hypothetical protein